MRRLQAIGRGETYVFEPSLMLAGSLGDSPEDNEEEPEDGWIGGTTKPNQGQEQQQE